MSLLLYKSWSRCDMLPLHHLENSMCDEVERYAIAESAHVESLSSMICCHNI